MIGLIAVLVWIPEIDHCVGRRDRGAATGLLPAAELRGVPGPADIDGHRKPSRRWVISRCDPERDGMPTLLTCGSTG